VARHESPASAFQAAMRREYPVHVGFLEEVWWWAQTSGGSNSWIGEAFHSSTRLLLWCGSAKRSARAKVGLDGELLKTEGNDLIRQSG